MDRFWDLVGIKDSPLSKNLAVKEFLLANRANSLLEYFSLTPKRNFPYRIVTKDFPFTIIADSRNSVYLYQSLDCYLAILCSMTKLGTVSN